MKKALLSIAALLVLAATFAGGFYVGFEKSDYTTYVLAKNRPYPAFTDFAEQYEEALKGGNEKATYDALISAINGYGPEHPITRNIREAYKGEGMPAEYFDQVVMNWARRDLSEEEEAEMMLLYHRFVEWQLGTSTYVTAMDDVNLRHQLFTNIRGAENGLKGYELIAQYVEEGRAKDRAQSRL